MSEKKNREDLDMRVIGDLEGIPIWYHEEQNIDEIVVSFEPIEQDPNAGRLVWQNNETGEIVYEDGKPRIPWEPKGYEAKFIVTGFENIDDFVEKHGKTTMKRINQRLGIYNEHETQDNPE